MADLIQNPNIQLFDHGTLPAADKGFIVTALAAPDEIRKLQQNGYVVVQHEDADEAGRLRQREIGRGNRYTQSAGTAVTGYLNVEEVESAILQAAIPPYSRFAELITLPEKTYELRQCHALKIGNGTGPNRTGVYFLGGVHAREWGSCDILINFIERIEQAYLDGMDLTFGGKTFSAAEIRTIVDTLDIVIFPQANPDGRYYSMTADPYWRKNRRPSPDLLQHGGVDINRNYDFLWDFKKYFSPKSLTYTSNNPNSEFYHGPLAFSEPETRNARWIVEKFPNTRFFIDLHSYGPSIFYRWGDSKDQTGQADMNFMNPCYDGARGVDSYGEYIPAPDLERFEQLAGALHDGIKAVRGTEFFVAPAFSYYATCGASDDYFYSRHFLPGGAPKIMSYTLEWGEDFHPPYPQMRPIIDEVTAGLLAFCLKIVATIPTQKTA